MTSSAPDMTLDQPIDVITESNLMLTREQCRPNLPHLGTYIIDTPRDTNWSWRQSCLQFHETHRGVLRKVNVKEPLPDIPKRYDLRTVPDGPEQDISTMNVAWAHALNVSVVSRSDRRKNPAGETDHQTESEHVNVLASRSVDYLRTFNKQNDDRMSDRLLRSSVTFRASHNRPRNRQAATSIPCFDSLCTQIEIQPNNSTRMKPSRSESSRNFGTTPIIKRPVQPSETCRKTEANQNREPDPDLNIGHVIKKDNSADTVSNSIEAVRLRQITPAPLPVKHVGHTSRHKEWSNLRLAEVLKQKAMPVLHDQILASMTNVHHQRTSHGVKREDSEDDDDVRDGEKWLHMVNTPLVDKNIYDKYANVKLCL